MWRPGPLEQMSAGWAVRREDRPPRVLRLPVRLPVSAGVKVTGDAREGMPGAAGPGWASALTSVSESPSPTSASAKP